jgi:release factor glutamine methyltransferase
VDAVEERLRDAGCLAAAEEAAALRRAAPDASTLEAFVRRREAGEPLAWITGAVDFGGRTLVAARGVYVPRPQTEVLARRAADLLPDRGFAADLCTGGGAVATLLAREHPSATVVGVDLDRVSVVAARRNGVAAVVGDAGAVPLRSGVFDVVTAVAPYVPTGAIALLPADVPRHEPARALDGGPDGLSVVRRVVAAAHRLLRAGGHLVAELGGGQEQLLAPDLAAIGFRRAVPWFDADGDLRGIVARRA